MSGRKKDKKKEDLQKVELDQVESSSKDGAAVDSNDENPVMKSEVEKLQAEIEDLQKVNAALQEQMLRVRAEADNFRKRMQREKDDFARFAREGFVRDLLPVKDNLERALLHAGEDPATVVDGVKLTLEQFDSIFKAMGVECVECLGAPFDPAFHQAMTQVESDEHEPNSVVDELQKGYQLHGRLLRPSMVTVAKAK